jgi:hypothetical protein
VAANYRPIQFGRNYAEAANFSIDLGCQQLTSPGGLLVLRSQLSPLDYIPQDDPLVVELHTHTCVPRCIVQGEELPPVSQERTKPNFGKG